MSDGALTFQQICRILDVTDRLGLDREWVEIPLSMERPGLVRRLPNGKLEIIADADAAFDEWLEALPARIRAVDPAGSVPSASEA
ncbi:MAG: hypothetical protein U0172_02350 [Nitrospiraceae bacterium]